ncbi:MAG: tRNA (N6-isopentenyl adenosine(37)-C2)-methylthiotransferase MiaB [Fimbriimonadales bacterium]|jgi:tRNA-2-methylthio-N6-dimethylallyladenosine synthase|nr:tRNA (N6-isopentenyl adenosine(37)-C2)-methylthiotransferase MiaB [Armatimonadota bacterium]MCX7686411.1 tRNA (N6-isopentenyl adenosine(37)-C2)-methylthiotransferase MiaB [Fimbriimonadales bacterium]CUU03826.1 tRNA-i(6)A37 thiotransferase enzyme MiaB [Armatimonadetes bacterium GBS]CUU33839.1 tRNA-i(6)A37 thiotransferase enzyme MiaB [Armatimonadetes bacterium GXS]CUU35361.1 tRNA-i(6)A37 thiotransferase enzyme MiaB [Armatimonadetes bacterium DC]GBC89379.1 tRNA-2-methylthio-N(6)-dimethylallyla
MPRYTILTWGCQMNEEDSEQMGLYLQERGYEPTERLEEADVVLLNTCSVRRKPEDKVFSTLGQLRKLKERKPHMVIGVCGCMAQLRAEEIKQRAPHVDMIVGTAHVAQVGALLEEVLQKRRLAMRLELPERKGAIVTDLPQRKVDRQPKLKAFVPIQYGCDKFCTFCIVPITRGRERSRPTADILDEIKRLAERGTKEVILLGQTVNSYGKNLLEGRVPFARLLKLINDIEGIERIRFTSPYPRDFRDDLIEAIATLPKVMEQVHLPLQSGDNTILKAMRRLYTVEQFEEIVHKLRERIPNIAITTDIIVGFPGETDEQFENTLKVVERIRFDGAFMFAYSPRPGTPAAAMENQVPRHIKQERLERLIALQNRITCEINASQVGRVFEVLVEGPSQKDPSKLAGFTRENKMMHFVGGRELIGKIVRVRADEAHLWGFYGTLVED